MCQAIVGKIIDISGSNARVSINGTVKKVNMELVDAKKGDYIICAGGVAIEKVDKVEAKRIGAK